MPLNTRACARRNSTGTRGAVIWALASVLLVFLAVIALTPGQSQAQDFLSALWGGGQREVVAFNPRYSARQLIVSFGDRKLYWIHRQGEAISYPIAVPREQSRWAGVTSVSSKKSQSIMDADARYDC